MFANIAVSKKSQRGERTRQLLTGIFYACFIIYGFVTPCEKLMLSRPLCGDGQRVSYGTVFLFPVRYTNSFNMSETEKKNLHGVKHSNPLASDTQKNLKKLLKEVSNQASALQRSYNQLKEDFKRKDEANARACYFIISTGLAKEYSEFCANNSEFDGWYNACLLKLGLDSQNNKSRLS